jgi:methionyl-tRNA formyltransferase
MSRSKKIKIVLFFNSVRGLEIYKHLKKKYSIEKIFISKKNLNKKILKKIKSYVLIDNLSNSKILKYLRNVDLGIIGGFPYIFKKNLIDITKYGLINCHAGILPKYRGGSPLNWQLINDEKYFGITTIKINEKIDKGDIILEKKFYLKKNYNINDLHRIANQNFPKIVEKSINKILKNKKLKKQKNTESYFHQRSEKDSLINFKNKNLNEIKNFVRALQDPYPNPYFFFKGKKIKFKKFEQINLKISPGEIFGQGGYFYIGCKDGSILVKNKIN